MTAKEIDYFAVPDPDDPSRMTYWRWGGSGMVSWPPQAKYGPLLWRRDIPRNLHGRNRAEWIHAWFAENRNPWMAKVFTAINDDMTGAAARFAAFTFRCGCCGKTLTDAKSKTLGVGPECRSGMPPALLAELSEMVGRIHAEHVANGITVESDDAAVPA